MRHNKNEGNLYDFLVSYLYMMEERKEFDKEKEEEKERDRGKCDSQDCNMQRDESLLKLTKCCVISYAQVHVL